MKIPKQTAYTILSLALLTTTSNAALLAYDPFAYTDAASLTGQNGGSGFSAAYTAAGAGIVVSSPGSTYTGLPVSGNKASFSGTNNNGAFRTLSSSPETIGTSVYISFLMQITNGTDSYAGVSLFNGSETAETLFLGKPNAGPNFGIDPKDGIVVSSTQSVANLSLLVYRIDFAAASTTISLFVNPDLTAPEPTVPSALATRNSALVYDRIRIQAGSSQGLVDEFRLGTTYADVVPEPSSTAILLTGMTAMLALRSRKG